MQEWIKLPLIGGPLLLSLVCAAPSDGATTAMGYLHDGVPALWQESDGQALPKPAEELLAHDTGSPHGNPVAEVVTGYRALEVLDGLKRRYPERFAGSGAALAAQGYTPTRLVTIVRTVQLVGAADSRRPGTSQVVPATRVESSEGQVIFQSWDDGYDGTWEGTIYVEQYSDGHWATWDAQLNIETEDYFAVWSEPISSGAPGGPGDDDPWVARQLEDSSPGVSIAALGLGVVQRDIRQVWHYGGIPYGYGMNDFSKCLVAGAAGCAATCRLSGPNFGGCFGACGAGVVVYCAVDALLK